MRSFCFRCLRLNSQNPIAAIIATPATAATVPPATAPVFDFATGAAVEVAESAPEVGATFPNAAGEGLVAEVGTGGAADWSTNIPPGLDEEDGLAGMGLNTTPV